MGSENQHHHESHKASGGQPRNCGAGRDGRHAFRSLRHRCTIASCRGRTSHRSRRAPRQNESGDRMSDCARLNVRPRPPPPPKSQGRSFKAARAPPPLCNGISRPNVQCETIPPIVQASTIAGSWGPHIVVQPLTIERPSVEHFEAQLTDLERDIAKLEEDATAGISFLIASKAF